MSTDIYQDNINRFEELFEKWIDIYRYIETSYFAIRKSKTSEASLLFSRVIFDTSKDISPFMFESEHILAGRDVIQVTDEEIREAVKIVIEGKIMIGGQILSLLPEVNRPYNAYFSPFHHPLFRGGPRFPALQIRGIPKQALLSQAGNDTHLDWEVQAADTPFHDLNELLASIGLPSLIQMRDCASIEILLRCPGLIHHESIIEKDYGKIQCQMGVGADINKIKLGYKTFPQGSDIHRGHLPGTDLEWEKDGDYLIGTANIDCKDSPVIQAFLSYDGESLHQWIIQDPEKHLNLLNAVHEVFDEGNDILRQFLLEPKDANNLELGVSMLLNLLGFYTSHHGHIPKIQKGPDIIATTPNGNVAVIECTIGLLDNKDKLAKLVQRSELIRRKLESSGYSHITIQPIIVTALSRSEVEAHIDKAYKHKVTVICREELEELLSRITFPPNAEQYFQMAVQDASGSNKEEIF